MKSSLFFLVLFICTIGYTQPVTFSYDLKVIGKTIGSLQVSSLELGKPKKYTVDSESEIHFFGSNTVKTHQEAVYQDGGLISSFCQTWKNGKLQDQTKVEKTIDGYTIVSNGTTSTIHRPITYSAILLYFIPPHSVKEVFSELEGVFKKISATGIDTFELADEGNQNNDYTYDNGILQKIVIDYGLVNILVLLRL